jgi:phosphoethanolamine N-methyltransferase
MKMGENVSGQEIEYDDDFIATLELMWGEGFLSPGGPEEVSRIVEGVDLSDKDILDIGCGIGGCDLHLLRRHGAGHILGIDVEPQLIERARQAAQRADVRERLEFELVSPGPFAYVDDCFDAVFSKDAMIHIADKAALYGEVLRVLKPGGHFLASDWLSGTTGPRSPEMARWFELGQLSFAMETPENTAKAMTQAGFGDVEVVERNDWFRDQARQDHDRLSGEAYQRLVKIRGQEAADAYVERTRLRVTIVEQGELCPCHLRARKPS